ncbi:MAG: TetR/AcrR family transcriptional regulator [Thalassotalea sp.]
MAPAPKFSTEQQEEMILSAAAQAIEKTSLLDFSMSAIAKLAGLSMGSVYKFVQCKEDVLIALATKMYQEKQRVFKQVLTMPLTAPERLIAISLLDFSKVQMFSFDDQLESIVNTRAIMKRSSRRWLDHMITSSKVCEISFQHFLENAVASGELPSSPDDLAELSIGSWSLMVGYFQTVRLHLSWNSEQELAKYDSLQPLAADNVHIKNLQRFINTFTWQQPLSSKDINKVCQHLVKEGLR